MSSPHPAVVLNDASFRWPDGSYVLRDVSAAFGAGRTGLIGHNGSGKTTLLRLIAGELRPGSGSLTTSAEVSYLPQHITLRTGCTMAELLGIRDRLDALRAIESGSVEQRHFDTVADDWDIATRADEALRAVGLPAFDLDRSVAQLSGGEVILAALAGLRVVGAPIVLLDEPTNNLDRRARHLVHAMVRDWPGTLLVVSHESVLLDLMDETAELRAASLRVFGGPYSAYHELLTREQEAAEQAVRTAEQALRTERRQRVQAETTLARRRRYARTDFQNKRRPKIIMNQRKAEAQVSAGKLRNDLDRDVEEARATLDRKRELVRQDARIRIGLPDPGVPSTRRLAELHDGPRTYVVQGPDRVALTGPNGIGKTRLLESMMQPSARRAGERPVDADRSLPCATRHTDRIGYLPQRIDGLDETASVLDNVRAVAPGVPPGRVRAGLARFLFRGDQVERTVAGLSGGERFRVALARLLLADPPPQLLVLDEPTNSLDRHSREELVDALSGYRGGLLVVSHDDAFLADVGITSWLRLDPDGRLRTGPPADLVE